MKWKPYPSYKPSGVEWLGDVPAHWRVAQLKRIAEVRQGVTKGRDLGGLETVDVPYLRVANVQDGYLDVTDVATISVLPSEVPRFALVAGDVLMNEGGDNDKLGRGAVWRGAISPCLHQNHVFAVRPHDVGVSDWIAWWGQGRAAKAYLYLSGNQTTNLASISSSSIREMPLCLPALAEQRAIAEYLDRTTVQIDGLVAKKRALVERLREKRTALISRTVTRGLPPEAARAAGLAPHPNLKPSGIPWLDDIPEHWSAVALRRAALVLDCKHRTVEFVDDGVPVASIREVHGFEVDLSAAKMTTEEEHRDLCEGGRRPLVGDIIYSRNVTVGDAALVATTERFSMGQDVCLLRPLGQVPRFLVHALRSQPVLEQVESLMIGSTFRRINVSQISALLLPAPPIPEQQAIAEYLDRETSRIDRLVEKVEAAIERLQEYRQALITAAVTGKIDVRELPDTAEDLRT